MSTLMHRLLLALFICAPPLMSACHTTEGFGRDVEAVGDAIEDEASEHTDDTDD